jgi:protein SCO1/2
MGPKSVPWDLGPYASGWTSWHGEDVWRGRALLVVTLGVSLAACGSSGGGSIEGLVRDTPLEVASTHVTDVTSMGAYADHDGSFEFVARSGALLVVYFGYTNCPDLCPTTLAELRAASRRLGDDATRVDLAMVTVDPERDTASVMNGFLSSFSERFHALRPTSTLELMTAQDAFLASSSITVGADGVIEVSHSANAYVVDESGRVLVEWPFGHGVDGMYNDLRVLLADRTPG